jgi:hypothetical protein
MQDVNRVNVFHSSGSAWDPNIPCLDQGQLLVVPTALCRRRLHSLQYRMAGAVTRDQYRQGDGRERENDCRPSRYLGENIDSPARAKGSLRALAAKRACQVCARAGLQQDNANQNKTNSNMNSGKKINHWVTFEVDNLRCARATKNLRLVRKGGLEPPCLSAPPPQDGVSAISPLPRNALRPTIPSGLRVLPPSRTAKTAFPLSLRHYIVFVNRYLCAAWESQTMQQ